MISWKIQKHAEAFPSRVIAQEGYPYIFNVEASRDVDQGEFIKRGAYKSLDLYGMEEATVFEGKVVEQAANGNWYIEVTNPGTAEGTLWVYCVPMINEEYNREFLDEANYYNEKGMVLRAYQLTVGDIIELSNAGFEGWDKPAFVEPTVGATVSLSSDPDYIGKLTY